MAEKMQKRSCENKSQFSVTCSLLSQYLKEKGSFGSIGLEMTPTTTLHLQSKDEKQLETPTTLSLLPGVDASTEGAHAGSGTDQKAPKFMELFPQKAGSNSPILAAKEEDPPNNGAVENAQLTIFYSGKVLVFDDFPADKAQGLLQVAVKESRSAAQNLSANYFSAFPPTGLPKPAQVNASADMPIARKNSLHRFLEKRKGRFITKGPYQVPGIPEPSPPAGKPDQASQSWLGLGQQSLKREHSSESSRLC